MDFERSTSATYLAGQIAKSFARALHSRSSALGFSPGQFPVLVELWQQDHLTQKQLLERLDVEQATLASTLSRMERDGLIARRAHPNDRRARIVSLTERARGMRNLALSAATDADDALFSGFRRFERELMIEYMLKILKKARQP